LEAGIVEVTPRIQRELELLRRYYPDLEYVENGQWVLLRRYPLPTPWKPNDIPTCFQIPAAYPGTAPYGFYVPADLKHDGNPPDNSTIPNNPPPFGGQWRMLSWAPQDDWRPTNDIETGSNLWGWCRGFTERFRSGR
jgi:hypothetical protein